jgi:hypothetical protein
VLLIAGSNLSAKTTNFDWVSEFVICLWHESEHQKKDYKFMGSGIQLSVTYSSPQKPKSYSQRDLPDYPFCFQQQ